MLLQKEHFSQIVSSTLLKSLGHSTIDTFLIINGVIFLGYDTNLCVQLWIFARYLEAFSLFIAIFYINKHINYELLFTIYFIIILLGFLSSYWIPRCFMEYGPLSP